ncbi:ABC transporter permease [Indibacter alkaliphilus]|nr:ABC transporter permease [Indibacter alkaliphilus]
MKKSFFYIITLMVTMLSLKAVNSQNMAFLIEYEEFDPGFDMFIDRKKSHIQREFKPAERLNESTSTSAIHETESLKFDILVFTSAKESDPSARQLSGNILAMDKEKFKGSNLKLVQGFYQESFQGEFNILISKEFSESLFGNEDPFNKILLLENSHYVVIKGIFKNPEKGLKYDVITNPQTFEKLVRRNQNI